MREQEYETVATEDNSSENTDFEIETPLVKQYFFQAIWYGPAKPQKPHVTLWCEKLQTWPYRVTKNKKLWLKYMFTLFPFAIWVFTYAIMNSHSLMANPTIDGQDASFIRCTTPIPAWSGHNADCGYNGTDCLSGYPVGTEFRFKCPANCRKESWTYRPLAVGPDVIYHQSFLVGGNNEYRADSFICAAALHRGIISDSKGGCGIARLKGPKDSFIGQSGNASIQSVPFKANFPATFSFDDLDGLELRGCDDKRDSMMLISLIAIIVIGYLSIEPYLFVGAVSVIGFWTVVLASNPPWNGGNTKDNAEVISLAARRLLPMLLAMVPIYKFSLKGALYGCEANLTRAIFWCIPFYAGIIENYVFGLIPIDRLTVDDLNSQAGAWLALFLIAGIVTSIVFGQAYIIWRTGKFWPYIIGYISAVLFLAILANIPAQTLRIHHYILALLFLPGTGFQTTPSFVYNGLLTALFIAGISRWDFDSILQTYDQLRRGGPEENTGMASFIEPIISDGTSAIKDVMLNWNPLNSTNAPNSYRWNGFSLLINDVEYYRGNSTTYNLTAWARDLYPVPTINYVRLAIADIFSKKTGSFTMAGVVNMTSGEWTAPLDGMT